MQEPNANLSLVPFVSVENMMHLILEIGVETCMGSCMDAPGFARIS